MRSNQILAKLRQIQALDSFSSHLVQTTPATTSSTKAASAYSINNLDVLRDKVQMAVMLPVVEKIAIEFSELAPLQMAYRWVDIDHMAYLKLNALARKLDIYIEAMAGVIAGSNDEGATENEVSIRLPSANHLASVSESLARLDKVFGQAMSVLPESPKVTVKRWETGSLWIDILVGSVSGVVLIGGLAWAAACSYKKFQEGRLLEKMSESLGIKNEVLGAIRDGVARSVDEMISAEAARLEAKHSKGKGDPETIQRLQFCIREFYDMIRSGAEIHPSLQAPEDVKNVFPNMEQVFGLPSAQKLLKEHGEGDPSPQDGEG